MSRYVVVGAGAIGGTIGGRLHQAGADVVLVARGAHGEAIQADGLLLRDPDGEARLAIAVRVDARRASTGATTTSSCSPPRSTRPTAALDAVAAVAPAVVAGRVRHERPRGRAAGPAPLRRTCTASCVMLPGRPPRSPASSTAYSAPVRRHPRRRPLPGRRRRRRRRRPGRRPPRRPASSADADRRRDAAQAHEAAHEPRQRARRRLRRPRRHRPSCGRRPGPRPRPCFARRRARLGERRGGHGPPGRAGIRMRPHRRRAAGRRLDLAEPGPRHRRHRGRLPQRRDRAPRPPARRADAGERRRSSGWPASWRRRAPRPGSMSPDERRAPAARRRHSTTMPSRSSAGSGHCGSISSSVSMRIRSTAQLRYHLRSAGTHVPRRVRRSTSRAMASSKAAW